MYPAAFVLKTQTHAMGEPRHGALHDGTDRRTAPATGRDDYSPRAGGVGGVLIAVFALIGYAAVLPF